MRTAAQAVQEARRWTSNRNDMCLYTVQTWFAAPWSGPYAEDAWRRWGGHHPGDMHPPAGVPVYWHNPRSRYGHIALSVGGGNVRSTDWPRDTRVGEVSIAQMTSAWRLQYLGWADRFSGGPIQGIGAGGPAPAVPISGGGWKNNAIYVNKLHEGQRDSDSVWNLQKRLIALGFAIPAGPTGNWPAGGQTTHALAAWQRSKNQPAPYNTGTSCGPRQTAALFNGTGIRIFP